MESYVVNELILPDYQSKTMKKLLLTVSTFIILAIGALLYIATPYVATPKFIVKNMASTPVIVTAHWRTHTKDLGELAPDTSIEFEVNDEAAMLFNAIHPNGRISDSSPGVYFTSGTLVYAVITDTEIEVATQP